MSPWEGLADPTEAEAAWVVDDAYQGRGIGSALVAAVIFEAGEHGVQTLVGEVLPHNRRMHHLLTRAVESCTWSFADDSLFFRIDVGAQAFEAA